MCFLILLWSENPLCVVEIFPFENNWDLLLYSWDFSLCIVEIFPFENNWDLLHDLTYGLAWWMFYVYLERVYSRQLGGVFYKCQVKMVDSVRVSGLQSPAITPSFSFQFF